jgi:hypothetical protein
MCGKGYFSVHMTKVVGIENIVILFIIELSISLFLLCHQHHFHNSRSPIIGGEHPD